MTGDPLLILEDAAFGYPGRTIVQDVSFEITRGEIVSILGPNGAGKTTLLRGILGLLAPTRGRLHWSKCSGPVRPPGYVPQHDHLDPIFPFSALEVVLMATIAGRSIIARVSKAEKEIARRSLELVGMSDAAAQRFSLLSGGQKQRVLIARALAVEPSILILDEPTAGVDPAAEKIIGELLRELNTSLGMTVVLVSHNLSFIRGFAASVVWVNGGTAVKGPADEALNQQRIESLFGIA